MKKPTLAPIFATLAFIFALGTYASVWSSVSAANNRVTDLSRQIQAESVESVRLASVRDRLAALGPLAGTIDNYFVPEADVVTFINELEARGGAVGATVQIASVSAVPATGQGHPALAIAITISGSFDNVLRALGSIEYSPHTLSVTSVTVAEAGDQKSWVASASVLVGTTPGAVSATAPATPTATVPEASTTLAATTTTHSP